MGLALMTTFYVHNLTLLIISNANFGRKFHWDDPLHNTKEILLWQDEILTQHRPNFWPCVQATLCSDISVLPVCCNISCTPPQMPEMIADTYKKHATEWS